MEICILNICVNHNYAIDARINATFCINLRWEMLTEHHYDANDCHIQLGCVTMYFTWGELLNYMNYSIRSSMRILSFSNGALKRKIQSGKKTKETEKKYAKICFHISAGTRFRYSSFFRVICVAQPLKHAGYRFARSKLRFNLNDVNSKECFFVVFL